MIGSLLGFLVFNFPPAEIFMGDAGSLVVGFLVALLTLRTTYYHQAQSGNWYPVFMPLIVMAVLLYDFFRSTVVKIDLFISNRVHRKKFRCFMGRVNRSQQA